MAQAKNTDTVKVHYTGSLENGTIFDSSMGQEPLQFTLGQNQVIPGFEQAIIGMIPGETRTVNIPYEEAYGEYEEELVIEVERSQFPADIVMEIGQQFQINQDELINLVTVLDFDDEIVTLDANHPLAGQNLIFEIQLVEILC